jgi:hypothetical protein
MELKTFAKVFYTIAEYGGMAGMLYSIYSGKVDLFAVSAAVGVHGHHSHKLLEVNEKISDL